MGGKKSKRDISIDIAKGIAIILVVWGHSGYTLIEKIVNLIHLPLFFFISGLLFNGELQKDYKTFLKKIITRLYLPYLISEFIAIAFRNSLFRIGFYSEMECYGGNLIHPFTSLNECVIELIRSVILCGREPIIGSIWFLVTLMLLEIAYYFINKFIRAVFSKRSSLIEVILTIVIWALGIFSEKYFYIGRLTPILQYWIFFTIGHIYGYLFKKSISIYQRTILIIFFAISVAIKLTQVISWSYMANLVYLIGSFSAISLTLEFSRYLVNAKVLSSFLSYVGKNSIYVMIVHFIGFKLVSLILFSCGIVGINQIAQEAAGKTTFMLSFVYLLGGVTFSVFFIGIRNKIMSLIKVKQNKGAY